MRYHDFFCTLSEGTGHEEYPIRARRALGDNFQMRQVLCLVSGLAGWRGLRRTMNTAEHASWRAQTCLWVMALARRLRWCTQRPTGVDRPRTRALREPQNILYALLKDSYAHSKDCELGTHLRKLGPGRNVHSHLSIPLPAIPTPF